MHYILMCTQTCCAGNIYSVYAQENIIHVLMRDENEGRKKQARSNKQQGKATQHNHCKYEIAPAVVRRELDV